MTFGTPFGQGGATTGTQTQTHIDEYDIGLDGEVDILIAPAALMPTPRPRNADRARAGDGAAGHPRDALHEEARTGCPRLRMELVDDPARPVPPPSLTVDELAPKLEFAAMFLTFVGATALQMWHDAASNMNTFGGTAGSVHVESQEDEVRTHSNAEMTYHGGRFRLEPGQALVVTVHEPERPFIYWGLTLTSPWMESFDGRYTHHVAQQRVGRAGGRRVVAAGDRADRPGPGRGQLAGYRGSAGGLHAGALVPGR